MRDELGPQKESLLGYVGNEGWYKQRVSKDTTVSSIGISFLPDFYGKYLPQRFRVDPEEIKAVLSDLKGGISVPEVELALKRLRSARPSPG